MVNKTFKMNTVRRSLINKSVKVLANGGLVAFPTGTVYGLGSDACNDIAVQLYLLHFFRYEP